MLIIQFCLLKPYVESYGLDDRGYISSRDNEGIFSLRLLVQTDRGAHTTSYPIDIRVSSPGSKGAGA